MRRGILLGGLASLALAVTIVGPGMMGRGMMGWNQNNSTPANLNLSTSDVNAYLQQWIAMAGNPRVKVGNATETGPDTITADIVTTEKEVLARSTSQAQEAE